jgi:uncharacterized membrane protein YeaQ/YmgE (transglycosylase-associated protein family)
LNNNPKREMTMHELWLLNLLIGLGVAQWVVIRLTLPDPPPDPLGWAIRTIAGGIGGVVGGWVAHSTASDPMPGIIVVGAVAGAAVLVGLTRAFSGGSRVQG